MFETFFRRTRFRIGKTPLLPNPELESIYGLPNLQVKDESKNPFGTFKDRRNALVIDKALKDHVKKVALITSGNSGYSLARLAEGTGVKVVCIIDKTIDVCIKENLRKYSYGVIEVDLREKVYHPDDVMRMARENAMEVVRDVTNDYELAFHSIVKEIKKYDPDFLITPLGSGEAFVGLYEGLEKHKMKTKLVGVGLHFLNNHHLELFEGPSVADKLSTPFTPYKAKIEEEILPKGHCYVHLSNEAIRNIYEKVKGHISCEPSAAAAFGALDELDIGKQCKVVVVNSGKGVWKRY